MKSNLVSLFTLLLVAGTGAAQTTLPVIRANSKTVSIRDGGHLHRNCWTIDPRFRPDTYFTNVPRKHTRITFITDADSISFDTRFGKTYDFVVMLNGRDSCFTRISAKYQGVTSPVGSHTLPDTIPFNMKGSRINFTGRLNGSEPLSIMFDLGAGGSCVNINSVKKAGIIFDGKVTLQNSDGVNEEPGSSNNVLDLGGLTWKKVPVVQIRNLDRDDDMIIGNSLFQDKVLEIDYDKKYMVVHDTLKNDLTGYSRHDVIYYQHRPSFEITVTVAGRSYPFYFSFDTGRAGTMLIGDDFTTKYGLWNKFTSIVQLGSKKVVVIPEIKIGALTFRDIITNANDPKAPNGKQSLIGNDILRQFNVILDNHQGLIYLKPNTLQGSSYATYTQFKLRVLLAAGTTIFAIIVLIIFVRRFRRSQRASFQAK